MATHLRTSIALLCRLAIPVAAFVPAVVALTAIATPRASFAETAVAKDDVQLVPATSAQILDAVRASGAKAVVVNLWATWCTPCREEFPDVLRFARAFKDRGVTLLLVSGDFASDTDPAREFLAGQGVGFRTFLKAEADEAFINAFDPAWSGALPATFVYDAGGARKHSFLGPVTYESLEREVTPLLGATP